jgi:hypothetical protein
LVELKINEINEQSLGQLEDYLKEREQILIKHPEFWSEVESEPNWIGVLVGSSISPELQRKLQDGYLTASGIPIAGMILRRFRSLKNEVFVITDTFFNYAYTSRDFSKFKFKGEIYNKGRLVNKVIKTYTEENPTTSYAELEKAFPQAIQGINGVFDTKEKAQEIYDRTGHKRHYLKSSELIKLSDAVIAASNQWGLKNITHFINHINDLNNNYQIENR